MYNLTNLTEAETTYEIVAFANHVVNDQLFGMLMVSVFFIMIFVMKKYEIDKALLAASFSCFILSMFLYSAKLLLFIYPLLFLIFMAFTALYMYMSK